MSNKGVVHERNLRDILKERGAEVMRAAGSHGSAGDLFACWPSGRHQHIEVKSVMDKVFYPKDSDELKYQFMDALRVAKRGCTFFYAIRWKTGALEGRWEFFNVAYVEPLAPMHRGDGVPLAAAFHADVSHVRSLALSKEPVQFSWEAFEHVTKAPRGAR